MTRTATVRPAKCTTLPMRALLRWFERAARADLSKVLRCRERRPCLKFVDPTVPGTAGEEAHELAALLEGARLTGELLDEAGRHADQEVATAQEREVLAGELEDPQARLAERLNRNPLRRRRAPELPDPMLAALHEAALDPAALPAHPLPVVGAVGDELVVDGERGRLA